MTRRSHRRAETAPFTVRLSPAERAAVLEKAARAGVKASEYAREALAHYERAEGEERITQPVSREIRTEYDE